MFRKMRVNKGIVLALSLAGQLGISALGFGESAFLINGKKISVEDVYKENQGRFYELEKQKYELIESIARQAYLDEYWQTLKTTKNNSVESARDAYLEKVSKVSEAEINDTLNQFKSKLSDFPPQEQREKVTNYLKSTKIRAEMDNIIQKAIDSKKLSILYPKPDEPLFDIKIASTDFVKYGPNASDSNPSGCKGDDCPITVVEYSEYECPFCVKVLPAANRLLSEYKGKVRWIVRDFPLGFHSRARPAAVAARCAGKQDKYWQMYDVLFQNQRKLEDEDLRSYGKKIKLDQAEYEKCLNNPADVLAVIEKNYKSGEAVGVTGTPAFFINGRRLSGALPFEEFKRIFDEELEKIANSNVPSKDGGEKKQKKKT